MNGAICITGLALAVVISLLLMLAHRHRSRANRRKLEARRSLIALSKMGAVPTPELHLVTADETPRPPPKTSARWRRMDLLTPAFVATAVAGIAVAGFIGAPSTGSGVAAPAPTIVSTPTPAAESLTEASSVAPSTVPSRPTGVPTTTRRTVTPPVPHAPVTTPAPETTVVVTTIQPAPSASPSPQATPMQPTPTVESTPSSGKPRQGHKGARPTLLLGGVVEPLLGIVTGVL